MNVLNITFNDNVEKICPLLCINHRTVSQLFG